MKAPITPTPPPASKNRTVLYVLLGFCGFFVLSFLFLVVAIHHLFGHSNGSSMLAGSDEIDLIEIQGPIYQSDDVIRRIKKFKKSERKALILRLNSPGG